MNAFSSQITFLNFRDYASGKHFLSDILELEPVCDIGWASVYAVSEHAFLGAVDHGSGHSLPAGRDAALVSLTTDSVEQWHRRLSGRIECSPIREIPEAGLKSFFFTGPEGCQFEIQQFLRENLQALFG